MTRLERARLLAWGILGGNFGWDTFYWAEKFEPFGWNKTLASLALDGSPATWRRICWHCDIDWGHNAGGQKLGHAPTMNGDEPHAPRKRPAAPKETK